MSTLSQVNNIVMERAQQFQAKIQETISENTRRVQEISKIYTQRVAAKGAAHSFEQQAAKVDISQAARQKNMLNSR